VHPLLNLRRSRAALNGPVALGAVAAAAALLWPAGVAQAASPTPSPSAGQVASGASPSVAPKKPATAAFGLGPATAKALDDRPTFVWSVTPAGTLTDHVALLNYSNQPLTLSLYAKDAFNAPSGALTLQAKNVQAKDAGSWITLEIPGGASTVTVPARSTVIVPIALTVPSTASPGDHTAGIITSLTAAATATNGNQTVNPNLEQRVAVPVEIRVSGPIRPKLEIQSIKASYGQTLNPVGGGHASVSYHVVNTGNTNLGGQEAVTISGLFGTTLHAKAPDIPVLLPGSSVIESVSVSGVLPEFLMTAHVTVTPLVPAGNVDPGLVVARNSRHFWAVPWLLLGIIAAGLVGWRQWRRRRRPSTGRHGTKSGGGTRRRGSAPAQSPRKPAEVAPDGITVANSSSVTRVVRRLAMAAVAAGFAFVIPVGTAWASSLPYADSSARGAVGLCDKNGNNITHGSVYDKPFVWRAVAAQPAPESVRGSGRNATLYAYQPRKGVDPAEWSGEQLTSNAAYSDPNVPIAQATDRDIALSDYLNDYPPQWDRLIELRIFYGSTTGEESATYPVADIRVTGTKWTLVSGAKVDCKTGTAISMEDALQSSNPAGRAPAQPLSILAAKAVGAPIPKASASSSAGATPIDVANASSSAGTSNGSNDGILLVGGAILVVVIGGVLYWYKRSRSA